MPGQTDPRAADELLPLVYQELRILAASRLAQESTPQTLQATALVHEAYLRIAGQQKDQSWNGRGHFFGAAAEAMRRILIEQARRKRTVKGGGLMQRQEYSAIAAPPEASQVDMIALDEALQKLEAIDFRKAQIVKLRFFAGLTNAQVAEFLGISTSTADSDWAYARSWLRLEISGDLDDGA